MRKLITCFAILWVCLAAGQKLHAEAPKQSKRLAAMAALQVGDSTQKLLSIAETVHSTTKHADPEGIVTAYHYCDPDAFYNRIKDPMSERDRCTSVFVRDGRIVAIGVRAFVVRQAAEKARREVRHAFEQRRQQQKSAQQAEAHSPSEKIKQQVAEAAKAAHWRRQHERVLLKRARQLPATDLAGNLALYAQLTELNPDKALYQRKKAHYQRQLTRQESDNRDKNNQLRQPKGNAHVAVGLQDLGDRGWFVWVENRTGAPLDLAHAKFRIEDRTGKRFSPVRVDSDFSSELAAEKTRGGRLHFPDQTKAARFLFSHPATGEVVRRIP